MRSEGLFDNIHYFLKPLELQRDERLDMTRIPSDKDQFKAFLDQHVKKKDLSLPYILNEYIEGKEFAANVVCKNGQIYILQVRNKYIYLATSAFFRKVIPIFKKCKLIQFQCF